MGARLFAAVLPPADVVEALDAFLEPRRDADPQLRWVHPEGWHLTTAFLADVPPHTFDDLAANLAAAAARTSPFDLALADAGAFPNPATGRALWVGVRTGADDLAVLARRSRTAADRAGVRVDGTRFVPHLTLARLRRPVDVTRWLRVLDAWAGAGWRVDELALVESHLHDRGRRYEVVGRFGLGSAD